MTVIMKTLIEATATHRDEMIDMIKFGWKLEFDCKLGGYVTIKRYYYYNIMRPLLPALHILKRGYTYIHMYIAQIN